MGVAAVALVQAWAVAPYALDLYGEHGFVQWSIGEALLAEGLPRIGWLAGWLARLGIGADTTLTAVFAVHVLALLGLLAGWRARAMAVVAWLIQFSMSNSGLFTTYGVDAFLQICLFYCAVFPVGASLSLDARRRGTRGEPTPQARLALRVLQIHLCLVYFSSAAVKVSGVQWWNGEAIWRAVMQPQFAQYDLSWLAHWPLVAMLAGWGTLVVEGGYAFLVWPRRTRLPWVGLTIALHAGIALFLGLWLFGAMMIVMTAAAFGVPAEPAAAPAAPGRLPLAVPARPPSVAAPA